MFIVSQKLSQLIFIDKILEIIKTIYDVYTTSKSIRVLCFHKSYIARPNNQQ